MSDVVRERAAQLSDFSGGLNNYWDPASIADNEVPYLMNMEFTSNGALTSRPPMIDSGFGMPTGTLTTGFFQILGYYSYATDTYLIGSTSQDTWAIKVHPTTGSWTKIWDEKASDFVQYNNKVVMCRTRSKSGSPTSSGAYWEVGDTTWTDIPTMPFLSGLELFRERIFGFGAVSKTTDTALFWSDIITLDTPAGIWNWNADSYVYIGRGDGEIITGLIADYNGLIIFKSDSTYNFVYSDLPEEGTVSLVQHNIGCDTVDCYAPYQDGWVVLHEGTLYKFENNVFSPLNALKVKFEGASMIQTGLVRPKAVSIFGDRAIVNYYGQIYVLNLQTGTWSRWSTQRAKIFKTLDLARNTNYAEVIAYGTAAHNPSIIYKIENSPVSESGSEAFSCELRTRIFDFKTPSEFKRMFWWAADIAAAGAVTGKVIAVGDAEFIDSWNQMDMFTWDYLDGTNWDELLPDLVEYVTNQNIVSGAPKRVALKMDRSLRFRRAYFELYLNCDGTAETAPAQIFSLTPMVSLKAKMSKDVA